MNKPFLYLKSVRASLFLLMSFLLALNAVGQQNGVIRGTVADSKGNPLPGVSIVIRGTSTGTTSNNAGDYTINAHKGDFLIISSVGFSTQDIEVGSSSIINILLVPSNTGLLNEVVVVGYGSQKKSDITGSVSSINVSDLKDVSLANATQMLQGQAPGVAVKQTTGAPGLQFQVRIRGLGSLGAGSSPLYVIDGFPVGTSIGQNLNPDDIANITVLKDAVSTAIYGARGANGVVLITTKQGQAGKTTVRVTGNYGIQNVPQSKRTKMLTGPEFAEFRKEAFMDKIRYFENREPDIDEVPEDFRYPEQTKTSTNWLDNILHDNAPYQNYNVEVSNGNDKFRSLLSVGYIDQSGSLIESWYKNFSARANLEGKINDFIKVGLNVSGSFAKLNWDYGTEGRSNAVGAALLADPREPIYNDDGSFNAYIGGHDGIFGFPNPVQNYKEVMRRKEIGDLLSTGYIEISFLNHFKFKTDVGAHLNDYRFKGFVPSTLAGVNAPPPRDASESDESDRTLNTVADQLLTYTNSYKDHHFDVLLGATEQKESTKGLSATGSQYPSDRVPFLGSAAITTASSTQYGWTTLAYFGRLNYSYKEKYLLTGTFRREGSSRFGEDNRWGNFPAISAGWIVTNEDFIPKTDWLNNLKLRASWGETGNNDIGNYTSLSFMNPSNYILGGNFANGEIISSLANPILGWEKAKEFDAGIDVILVKNKITFTADFYNRITSNMLLPIQLPAISGFTSTWGNIGKVRNHGVELALGYNDQIGKVGVRGNFNISFNRNKVLDIRGENDEIWSGDMYGDYNVSKIGRPIGMIYGFKTLGIFQDQDEIDKSPVQDGAIPGVFKYFDANGDGIVEYDQTDMVEIGNPWPKATFGLTLGGDYKGFDLNIIMTGAEKYDLFRQIESSTMNMDGVFNVLQAAKDRYRSPSDPGAGIWPTTNTWKWERESNSRYIHDGSHIWIKSVSIGYTLPKSRIKFGDLRVFLSSDNLLLITNYPGNNPDIDLNGGINPGLDDEAYPVPRVFSAGFNLTL